MHNFSNKHLAILSIAFVSVCAVTIANHEMWRDELHAWLIARESGSFVDLIRNTQYEVHPELWFFLLALLAKISPSPYLMQAFNLAIGVAATVTFLRFSPFNSLHKSLFIFGYFPLYEYSVISRPYGLTLFLSFLFVHCFTQKRSPLATCLVIFLLANSSPVGLIVGSACGFLLFLDYLPAVLRKSPKHLTGLGFAFAGTAISFLSMLYGSANNIMERFHGFNFSPEFGKLLYVSERMFDGFLPINNNWWIELPDEFHLFVILAPIFTLGLVAYISKALRRSPSALRFYLVGTAGLCVFFYIAYSGGLRHDGFFFVVFIMALWIFHRESKSSGKPPVLLNFLLTVVLSVHVAVAAIMVVRDNRFEFSNGRKAAAFIERERLDEMPIFSLNAAKTDSVLGYMEKGTKVYFPEKENPAPFYEFSTTSLLEDQILMKWAWALERARGLADRKGSDLLVMSGRPVHKELLKFYNMEEKARFTGSAAIRDELFYLYVLRNPPGGRRN